MENKNKAKEEIQAICEKYHVGIAMMPHVQKDGILVTMDIVEAPNEGEEAVIKDITSEKNETLSSNAIHIDKP